MKPQLDVSLAAMVLHNEARHGGVAAYMDGERTLTHRVLAQRGRQLGQALYRQGCRHQDRVAILSRNCIEYGEIYAACQLAGFIAATVNFRLAAPEVIAIVADSRPRVFFFEAAYTAVVATVRDAVSDAVTFVCLDEAPDWAIDYAVFRDSEAATALPFAGSGDDIAAIVYTSGSTGKPKGCIIGQRQFARLAQALAGNMRLVESDRLALPMPMFHIGAKSLQAALHWQGATVVVMQDFRPAAYLQVVQDHRITKGHLAPTMIHMLLDLPERERYDLRSLNLVMYSASAMPVTILRRAIAAFGNIFQNGYGMTEGAVSVLDTEQHNPDGGETALRRLRSVGIPYATVQVAIMSDDDIELPAGERGEICIRSDLMFRGYWNNSVATIETMRNGWYHSGDVGMVDEDGYIYLLDRKKDMIVSGGENIYSREVEDAVLTHPGVSEVAVIGVPEPKWGEAVCAIIVRRAGADPSADDIIAHCRSLIASYKKPRQVMFVDEMPKFATGKVNKLALRDRFRPLLQPNDITETGENNAL